MPEPSRRQPDAPRSYPLADAARDLAVEGLLLGALTAEAGAWRQRDPEALTGAFAGAVLDSRQVGPDLLFVGLRGPRMDGRQFAPAALTAGAHALVGPGGDAAMDPATDSTAALRYAEPAPARGTILVTTDALAALTCLAARWRRRQQALIIGITGTNGKTTTKDLLAAALAGAGDVHATAGNLNSAEGVPVTLLGLRPEHRFAVVEMGASAIGHIAARATVAAPTVGIITNAAAAHLSEFGSLAAIIEGKGELVAALPPSGVAILNADSPGYDQWRSRARCRVMDWGRQAGAHRWDWRPGDRSAPGVLLLDDQPWPVPLPGRHNGANLCAAILAARAAGLSDAQIHEGLRTFRASPHRGSLRRLAGRLVLDDCYNANPESMRQAAGMLCDLPGGAAWAVLGGMAELGDHSDALHHETGAALARLAIDRLIAVGDGARLLAAGFAAAGGRAATCADPAAAAELLAAATEPGDRILIKGSRSTGMERVLDALRDDRGWTEDAP